MSNTDATDPDESPTSHAIEAALVELDADHDATAPDGAVATVEVDGCHPVTIRDGVVEPITDRSAYKPTPSVEDAIENALHADGYSLTEYRRVSIDTRVDHAGDDVEAADATVAFEVAVRDRNE